MVAEPRVRAMRQDIKKKQASKHLSIISRVIRISSVLKGLGMMHC